MMIVPALHGSPSRWRTVAIAVLVGVIVSACASTGGDDVGGDAAATGQPQDEVASSDSPSGEEAATRTVEHALGTTEISGTPERVVSTQTAEWTDCLLGLGIEPVGTPTYGAVDTDDPEAWPESIAPQATSAGITGLGQNDELDLEQLAELDPDLIIAADSDEGVYPQLSEIAPTVVPPSERDFRPWLRKVGDALGREQQAEERIAEYEALADEVRDRVGGSEVAIVRPRTERGTVYVYGPPSNAGVVLENAGIELTEAPEGSSITEDAPGAIGEISAERITEITAPNLIVLSYNIEADDPTSILDDPLWQQLPAVQDGNVTFFTGFEWTNHCVIGAEYMLEQAADALGADT